jgi:hypothetical protein
VAEMVTLARDATGATEAGMAEVRGVVADVNMDSTEPCRRWARQLN